MKLKQISTPLLALVLFVSAAIVSLSPVADTALAYKCTGTPDDFYQNGVGDRTKLGSGQQKYITQNNTFRFDSKTGRCMVDIPSTDGMYKSQYADGSARPCNGTDVAAKVDGSNMCLPVKTYSTNDKPVHDDGSPLTLSEIYCGGNQDNYDAESFSCKESGSCNLTGTCDYNQVGLVPDPTTNCVNGGGIYNKNNTPTCAFTAESCKKVGKKLDAKTKQCAELDTCDKQFGGDPSKKEQYDACERALNSAGANCNQPDPSVKAACEAGKSASGFSGNFGECGDGVQTVLISCSAKDCGVGGGAFKGTPVIGCVLKFGIQALTVLIGIAAVGGIAWEAMQYARAQDDQSTVSNARKRIRDIVIGLFVYGFMIAIINWLVPGSVIQ